MAALVICFKSDDCWGAQIIHSSSTTTWFSPAARAAFFLCFLTTFCCFLIAFHSFGCNFLITLIKYSAMGRSLPLLNQCFRLQPFSILPLTGWQHGAGKHCWSRHQKKNHLAAVRCLPPRFLLTNNRSLFHILTNVIGLSLTRIRILKKKSDFSRNPIGQSR